jgi:hypothetical protein
MTEYRDVLERIADRATMPEPAMERLVRRRARRQRNRRIAAGAVGVAITIVLLAVLGTGGALNRHQPIGSPTVAPSSIGTVTITNAGCTIDGDTTPAPGAYTVLVINDTDETKTLVVAKVASDQRYARILALVDRIRPRFGIRDHHLVQTNFQYGNTSTMGVDAHESVVISGAFNPGTYGIQCAGQPPQRDRSSNFIGPIDVPSGGSSS